MKRRIWLAAGLLALATASIIGFLYWNSPERRIRAVLSDGETAIEAKDLARVMSHVSLQYRDEQGFAYLTVKKLLEMAFDEFEGLDVRLSDVNIEVQEDRALVQTDSRVIITAQGEKAYIIGDHEEPVPVRIALAKETLKWRIQSVNGIRMPFNAF